VSAGDSSISLRIPALSLVVVSLARGDKGNSFGDEGYSWRRKHGQRTLSAVQAMLGQRLATAGDLIRLDEIAAAAI
jgi:hypothetical protein